MAIPRRHVGSFFDLTVEERDAILTLLEEAQKGVDAEFHPDGYNIGINDGAAAGQTVPHLHIHLIPRYKVIRLILVVAFAGYFQTKLIIGASVERSYSGRTDRVPPAYPEAF